MRISDILRHKGDEVVTVQPEDRLADLLDVLARHEIGAAVVSRDGRAVDGIISERDVVRALAAQGSAILASSVRTLCTRDVRTAAPGDTVDELMVVMTERRCRHVPVVSDGQLVGLVSIGDVVRARVGELEEESRALTHYITGVA